MKRTLLVLLIITILSLSICLVSCSYSSTNIDNSTTINNSTNSDSNNNVNENKYPDDDIGTDKTEGWDKYTKGEFGIKNESNPLVEIKFSTGDSVRLELYPDVAPKTVANFIKLAKSGAYNGLTMHRIIKDFMIQGGGYTRQDNILEDAFGDSAQNIYGEFSANGWENNISHQKGVISMARATPYNSASTQFFICSVDCDFLDGNYCAFGRVIDVESMEAVVKLSLVPTGVGYTPQGGTLYRLDDVPIDIINIVSVEIRE